MGLSRGIELPPVEQHRVNQRHSGLGWTPGRNVEIEYRWGAEFADRNREYAAELVALAPDVIVDMGGSPGLAALQRATRTVPIVFANIVDPVGQGFVEGLARPGGNITGFTIFEYGLSVKWLELLKKIVPGMSQVAVARDAATAAGNGEWGAIQSVAPSFGVELRPVDTHEASAIEQMGDSPFARCCPAQWIEQ